MAKNLIPEIAKMLGVELGEVFKIKGYEEWFYKCLLRLFRYMLLFCIAEGRMRNNQTSVEAEERRNLFYLCTHGRQMGCRLVALGRLSE